MDRLVEIASRDGVTEAESAKPKKKAKTKVATK
jgi:hypothetical protein